MIWFRRFLALIFIAVFVPSLVLTITVLGVNGTFLEPEFWIDELEKADVYNFVYDDLLPAGVDEALPSIADASPVDLTLLRDDLIDGAREILPPDWMQEQTENAIRTVPGYLLGDIDSFELKIETKERVASAFEVIDDTIQDDETFVPLYDQIINEAVTSDSIVSLLEGEDSGSTGTEEASLKLPLTPEEMAGFIREIMPAEWLQVRAGEALEAIEPYAIGDAEGFTITVPLSDRVEVIAEVLKEILAKADTQTLLVDQAITPLVDSSLGTGDLTIAPGVDIPGGEVDSIVGEVLSGDFITQLEEDVIDTLADYLTGESDTLAVSIDLSALTDALTASLGGSIDGLLAEQYNALPECTVGDILAGGGTAGEGEILSACRLEGVTWEQVKELSGLDTSTMFEDALGDMLPGETTLAEEEIREILGPDMSEGLDKVRDWTLNGFTFTEEDILENLGPSTVETVDDVRGYIRDGYVLTEDDILDAIRESEGGQSDVDSFVLARRYIGMGRSLAVLAWVEIGFLLLLIGSLGGRNWGSRFAWASVVLGLFAGAIWVGTGLLYDGLARPIAVDFAEGRLPSSTGLEKVFTDRAFLFATNVIDDFMAAIASQALILTAIAGAGLVLGIVLQAMGGKQQTPAAVDASAVAASTTED